MMVSKRKVTDAWIAEIEARARIVEQEAAALVQQIQAEREALDAERKDNGNHA